ncbi:hypothetical protein KUTeg_023450 [Tegillarca granosa]|uniref:Rieske domain-containing protein n=1 Tax=Tegillarca granosa TaxID=220873 RepID=A0ABQ9E2N2_TEGGR|nr:hypothetical protein KUTeg_023450 [Tegillarca granosa]
MTTNGIIKPPISRQNSRTGALVNTNEKKIALFRFRNDVYAIDEKCPHAGGPLHLDDIEELSDNTLCVRCPWHSWKFDLQTGHLLFPKRKEILAVVYPVIVSKEGKILVGFDHFDPKYFTCETDF